MIKDDNFVHIAGWMINELNLKGNELFIYSIIHGFSQDGKSDYHGGLAYLAEWTNSTKQGVIKNLKSLIAKGFIVKVDEQLKGNVHLCHYFSAKSRENTTINVESKQSLPADHSTKFNTIQNESGKQSLTEHETKFNGGIKQSLPNKNSLKEFKNISSSENKIPEKTENSAEQEFPEIQTENDKKQKPESQKTKAERQTEILDTLKKLFGNTRLFTNDFIPKLSALCEQRQLPDEKYISWTYETLQKKNVSNFTGYFFRMILSEPNVSKFLFEETQKKSNEEATEKEKLAPKTKCKCCGAELPLYNDCPVCGLLYNERNKPEKISFHRKIYQLPADRKNKLNSEIQEMRKKSHISMWNSEKDKIYKKYGVI